MKSNLSNVTYRTSDWWKNRLDDLTPNPRLWFSGAAAVLNIEAQLITFIFLSPRNVLRTIPKISGAQFAKLHQRLGSGVKELARVEPVRVEVLC